MHRHEHTNCIFMNENQSFAKEPVILIVVGRWCVCKATHLLLSSSLRLANILASTGTQLNCVIPHAVGMHCMKISWFIANSSTTRSNAICNKSKLGEQIAIGPLHEPLLMLRHTYISCIFHVQCGRRVVRCMKTNIKKACTQEKQSKKCSISMFPLIWNALVKKLLPPSFTIHIVLL